MAENLGTMRAESNPLIWTLASTEGEELRLEAVSTESFEERVRWAQIWLREQEIGLGSPFLAAFGENHIDELVLRQASQNIGVVPVTVNWQADTIDSLVLKLKIASTTKLVIHGSFSSLDLEVLQQRA
mgnify:CR=1 FL=1